MFLGTRGEIEARTWRHHMHSLLLVSYRGAEVMIDCGLDWLGRFERLRPDAIVLTHAHPDHAWGLKNGASCPVHAPQKTWRTLKSCNIDNRQLIKKRTPECLWHHSRGIPGRTLDSGLSRRIPRERRPSVHFLRAGSRVHP